VVSLKAVSRGAIFLHQGTEGEDMNDAPYPVGASASFREVLRVAWDEAGDFPGRWIAGPQTSAWTDGPPPRMRAPIRVRALPTGDIAVLAKDPAYFADGPATVRRYSAQGELRAALRVEPPSGVQGEVWRITDFLADAAGAVYLLETLAGDAGLHHSLRKLDSSGAVVWARAGSYADDEMDIARLRGNFGQLLTDASGAVYLAATRHRGLVARLDPASGEPQPYADWGEWTGEVFMDGEGRLYYVRYDPESRRRGWACYDPRTRSEEVYEGDESAYALFDITFGTDARGRCYSAMGMHLACLTREAEPLWQEQIDNVVVADGGALYASQSRPAGAGAEVVIKRWEADGAYAGEMVLSVPSPPARESLTRWRLVSLDDAGRFHVRGGAAGEEAELVYSTRGELEAVTQPAPDSPETEFSLSGSRDWSVDLEGGVYLSVLGPLAFHLLRLTVGDAPHLEDETGTTRH
jgi:hypothetical protein